MDAITSLFRKGLSSVFGNWREIAAVVAIIWVVTAILNTGTQIGRLSEETAHMSQGMAEMKTQLNDLRDLHKQMIGIQREQLDLTKKLGLDYEEQRAKNEADTAVKVDAVTNGTLRMSIRKPSPVKSTVPFPAAH